MHDPNQRQSVPLFKWRQKHPHSIDSSSDVGKQTQLYWLCHAWFASPQNHCLLCFSKEILWCILTIAAFGYLKPSRNSTPLIPSSILLLKHYECQLSAIRPVCHLSLALLYSKLTLQYSYSSTQGDVGRPYTDSEVYPAALFSMLWSVDFFMPLVCFQLVPHLLALRTVQMEKLHAGNQLRSRGSSSRIYTRCEGEPGPYCLRMAWLRGDDFANQYCTPCAPEALLASVTAKETWKAPSDYDFPTILQSHLECRVILPCRFNITILPRISHVCLLCANPFVLSHSVHSFPLCIYDIIFPVRS